MKQKYGWKWFLSVVLLYLYHSVLLYVPYHLIIYGRSVFYSLIGDPFGVLFILLCKTHGDTFGNVKSIIFLIFEYEIRFLLAALSNFN